MFRWLQQLFFVKLYVRTPFQPEEILSKVQRGVREWGYPGLNYRVSVYRDGFEIWQPYIYRWQKERSTLMGTIYARQEYSVVMIRIYQPMSGVLGMLFVTILGACFLYDFIAEIIVKHKIVLSELWIGLICLSGILYVNYSFRREIKQFKKILCEVLKAEVYQPTREELR